MKRIAEYKRAVLLRTNIIAGQVVQIKLLSSMIAIFVAVGGVIIWNYARQMNSMFVFSFLVYSWIASILILFVSALLIIKRSQKLLSELHNFVNSAELE